ncbi:arylesterase [Polycladidibacter stylochi]|uniref:arylesterase n=1 Tax=Polycladidibacter stylochi TaxID=1807766 RepID=UPI0008347038|nr:arylesterase [Pseudovibrio stylochi]
MRKSSSLFAFVVLLFIGFSSYAVAQGKKVRIVAFGDSLTAGYLLSADKAFPVQLENALKASGYDVSIANAGVSGDTTGAGLARLNWSVPEDTQAVILEFGGNDTLRGFPTETTRDNLEKMIVELQRRGIKVLLAGMMAPRNMGEDYTKKFDSIYSELAVKYQTYYYPFFLEGVATDPRYTMADGIHPTADGVAVIVKKILPFVEEMIIAVETDGH